MVLCLIENSIVQVFIEQLLLCSKLYIIYVHMHVYSSFFVFLQRQSCATTWTYFNIPWESYVCKVTMNYGYYSKSFQWLGGKASRSCSAFTCNM